MSAPRSIAPDRKRPAPHSLSQKRDQDAEQQELELLRLMFDSIYHGGMITDARGQVTHMNAPYGRFLGVDPSAQLGKHCTEVVENTRMHIVAQTGKPEINWAHRIKGHDMVVQRIPIKKDGKIVAVFGQVMFKDVKDVGKLARKLTLLESKIELYEKELMAIRSTRYTFDSIVGVSEAMQRLRKDAMKAAATQLPVLISGESGTGKELFAQAIHHASARRLYPFVRINCAAIPQELLESELFGYEQGAFTGALYKGKPGKFELAHHGTVFLDEIGDLPLHMQPKLLRVLEEKEFERVGGTAVIPVDFRLVAATNQNLEQMVADGRFRRDLFYRLNVFPLKVPPLRERREDILPLTYHALERILQDSPGKALKIDSAAEKMLRDHDWPGNARELCNVLERIISSMDGETVLAHHMPFPVFSPPKAGSGVREPLRLREAMARAEEQALRSALAMANGNKARAANLLGIHRTLLYKKMQKHGVPLD